MHLSHAKPASCSPSFTVPPTQIEEALHTLSSKEKRRNLAERDQEREPAEESSSESSDSADDEAHSGSEGSSEERETAYTSIEATMRATASSNGNDGSGGREQALALAVACVKPL